MFYRRSLGKDFHDLHYGRVTVVTLTRHRAPFHMLLAVQFDHLRSAGGPVAVMWGAEALSAIRRKAIRFDQCFSNFFAFLRYTEKCCPF